MANEADELSRIFYNTVVGKRSKGTILPLIVEKVINEEEEEKEVTDPFKECIFHCKSPSKSKWSNKRFVGSSLILSPHYTGARNYQDGVVYIKKSNVRQYSWGFNLRSTGISYKTISRLTSIPWIEGGGPSAYRDILVAILNPVFDVFSCALEKIRSGNNVARALSSTCFLKAVHDSVVVVYREREIGLVNCNDVTLYDHSSCFKEELISYGMPL